MSTVVEIKKRLEGVFEKKQADVLADVIVAAYDTLVKASDFNELKGIVKELAEAQKRTEQRVEELAQAQKRTEQRVEELAEAQKRTEDEIQKLTQEHRETRRQLGGLSMTVGYTLENEAYKALPRLLKKNFGVIIKGRLQRKFVIDNKGKSIEVNIIGEASRNGRKVTIIGECKTQLSKNDINEFLRKKLDRLEGVFKEIFPVLITHMTTTPEVEKYVKEKGIALFYSYDF
jgi:hypothetical protein